MMGTVDCVKINALQVENSGGGYHQVMLVGDVESVKPEQMLALPANVRFGLAKCSDDLFGPGTLFLSLGDNRFKPLLGFREGKCEPLFELFGNVRFQQAVSKDVERGVQVVDGISDDEREMVWNGFLFFIRMARLEPSASSSMTRV